MKEQVLCCCMIHSIDLYRSFSFQDEEELVHTLVMVRFNDLILQCSNGDAREVLDQESLKELMLYDRSMGCLDHWCIFQP
jgi:hypothetical protein